jgi:transcriptional regulator with XRE-family HTH domain
MSDAMSGERSGEHGAEREAVGAELREARGGAGLSQTTAARRLGIAQTSVSALERGLYLPDEALWDRLVAAYGIPAELAEGLWARIRAARRLRGAAAAGSTAAWPVAPATCSRRGWCGQLRRHHRLTRNELAAELGVPANAVAKLEQDDLPLPLPLKSPAVLRRLAGLGDTDEAALRTAWQAAEIDGLDHLIGLDGEELVAAARDAVELLRWLLATGRTQTELATACGVSRPAVSQWLSRRTAPTPAKLRGLGALLLVPPAALERLRADPAPEAR